MSNGLTTTEQGSIVTPQRKDSMTEIASSREIAEVQGAILLAKKFPRDEQEAIERIMIACQRPTLAEGALYQYARGGTAITGPSIRLAEAIAQQWGNISFGVRELEQRNGESTVEAFAWDMQTNTRQVKTFQVPHTRHTKKGSYRLQDSRDIYEMVANQGARRLRACILGVIPGDVVEAAAKQCEETMKAKADTTPDAIKKMLEAYKEYGVTKEMIEKRIQRKLDAITPAQKIGLGKIYNSLKDGMSTAAEWFEVTIVDTADTTAPQTGNEGLKNKLKQAKDKKDNPPTASGKQGKSSPVSDSETAPLEDQDRETPYEVRIEDAKSVKDLSDVANKIMADGDLKKKDRDALIKKYEAKVDALTKKQKEEPEKSDPDEDPQNWISCINGDEGECVSLKDCKRIGKTKMMIDSCQMYQGAGK